MNYFSPFTDQRYCKSILLYLKLSWVDGQRNGEGNIAEMGVTVEEESVIIFVENLSVQKSSFYLKSLMI